MRAHKHVQERVHRVQHMLHNPHDLHRSRAAPAVMTRRLSAGASLSQLVYECLQIVYKCSMADDRHDGRVELIAWRHHQSI